MRMNVPALAPDEYEVINFGDRPHKSNGATPIGPTVEEWPTMEPAAYYGLAGDIVRTIEPHSEADPVSILLQFLVAFGSAVGGSPYYQAESNRHHANLFVVLVGNSSKSRKGTSWSRICDIMKEADETWKNERTKSGLSSGEGLINEVRDPRTEWNKKEQREEVADQGIKDKRLLVTEEEFAGLLSVAERHGNTLSPIIRKAWDGGKLSTLTKNTPLTATGAHISIIGHITIDELRVRMTRTDIANGFANRFLYASVKRSKELPFGGSLSDSEILLMGENIQRALDTARNIGRVSWTDEAAREWARIYSALSSAKPGLLGAITARAEAQVVRLATLYALLDGSTSISFDHLRAAVAVWDFCEASATHVFGDAIGDPVADQILRALRQAGAEGMTRTAISHLFGRHQSSDQIGAALGRLMNAKLARAVVKETSGRPSEVWFAEGKV
jgi:hypothetical protein